MVRFLLALAAILPLVAAAPVAQTQAGRIGDLAYDDAVWRVERDGDIYRAHFHKHDDGERLTVKIAGGEPSACSAAAMTRETEMLRDRTNRTISKPGFDIYVVTSWLGCRNARPPSVHACAAYKGRIYRFDAAVFSCRGGPQFVGSAVDFLEQLSVP